jgi:hypothetical protein
VAARFRPPESDVFGEALGKVVKLESKLRAGEVRCTRLQRRPKTAGESPLTPELKEFIDRAIVPILVKEYLAVTGAENGLAKKDSDVAR